MKLFAQEKVIQSVESSPKYQAAYTAAQAGGMNEADSHEFAQDQASRPVRLPVADPLKEAKELLVEALIHNKHAEHCQAQAFVDRNRCCPPSHPIWKVQPPCTCWVGRLGEWLKNNS